MSAVQSVAVCICSGDMGEGLSACLESILAQKKTDGLERHIIVVDNRDENGRAQEVSSSALASLGVLVVRETARGIPFARNAALEAALGLGVDAIAFIDDDELAPFDWLQTLVRQLAELEVDVVHGKVIRAETLAEARAAAAIWTSDFAASVIRRRDIAATNNVIFRAHLVAGADGLRFDEAFARIGGSDTDFFMRAALRGSKIVRSSIPPVYEVWPQERLSSSWKLMRDFRNGVCANIRYRKNLGRLHACAALLSRSLVQLLHGVEYASKGALLTAIDRARARQSFVMAMGSLYFAAGCISPYFKIAPTRYY